MDERQIALQLLLISGIIKVSSAYRIGTINNSTKFNEKYEDGAIFKKMSLCIWRKN